MEFIKYNANPKQKRTNDCVIRAISTATGIEWKEIYSALSMQGIKNSLMLNDPKNWRKYLEKLGYEKYKMPRRADNTRYTVEEFCDEIANDNEIYIIKIAGHLTCIKDKKLYDTWNCGKKSVGNYWSIRNS